MDESSYYRFLGFKVNPFQYTNADEEIILEQYFIPPPYFPSVWGDPQHPSSCVVFAPRGGGKSAQRKMLEIQANKKQGVMTVQYSRFEFDKGVSINDIDLNYHLININRICLIALLMLIYERDYSHLSFTHTERMHIRALSDYYLHDLSAENLSNAISSIMTLLDKAKQFCKNNLWAINTVVDNLFKKVGLSPIKSTDAKYQGIKCPSKNHLEIIISLIQSLGYDSVLVLVDKIDETALTGNDSGASFKLIAPILKDLELLQMKGIGFKFFLWNELLPFYIDHARPDRIPQFELKWNSSELKKMLELRLKAHSNEGTEVTFYDLFDSSYQNSLKSAIEDLVLVFCHGSPRDLIRICKQIVDEQLRMGLDNQKIMVEAATAGWNVFCKNRASEVVSSHVLDELQKNHRLDFTVNYVANEVFKIGQNAARAKILAWTSTGVVKRIDDIHIEGSKKPVHHYAVVDARVAKSIFPEIKFLKFLEDKIAICPKCNTALFRDWDISRNQRCHICKKQFNA